MGKLEVKENWKKWKLIIQQEAAYFLSSKKTFQPINQ